MVVRADSNFTGWEGLRGARLAINERMSYSGCDSVRVELANRGEGGDFFGAVVEAGSHEQSLAAVLQGVADVAAIDSTVLEEAVRRDATLAARLRMVHLLGPAAMPPWVLSTRITAAERLALQEALCTMHAHAEGRHVLEQTPLARFAAVDDSDYGLMRRGLLRAAGVAL
jgi:phosphonate transport system substrate-binding protein